MAEPDPYSSFQISETTAHSRTTIDYTPSDYDNGHLLKNVNELNQFREEPKKQKKEPEPRMKTFGDRKSSRSQMSSYSSEG